MLERSAAQHARHVFLASSAASAAACAASISDSFRFFSDGRNHCTRSFLLDVDGIASRTLSRVADMARLRSGGAGPP